MSTTRTLSAHALGIMGSVAKRDAVVIDDGAFACACIAREPGAWERFVSRYAPLIVTVARRCLRSRGLNPAPEDVDDICENTFLAFVRDDYALLRKYNSEFALSTYVGVVARTHASRFLRKRREHRRLDDVPPVAIDHDPILALHKEQVGAAVRATIDDLSERDRQVLRLFYFGNADYRRIAESLNIRVNSVGAALHRARTRLRERLELKGYNSA